MCDYVQQAKDFLKSCNATMEINLIGREDPLWDEGCLHIKYEFTITTPLGSMSGPFYDSAYNSEYNIYNVTEYDILSVLEKYDVGTIDDFVSEFGYEVYSWDDVKRIQKTYNAVTKQYQDICRIFTPEQIEKLREIQ